MSPNPQPFILHLQAEGYHPRSDKHSNVLAEAIAADLVRHCAIIGERAAKGAVVYDVNFTLRAGTADWNVDLVLGKPELGTAPPAAGAPILRRRPSTVEIAIEIKSIMTEHHKAAKNRKRDLDAHHDHVHNYSSLAIAGGVFVINAASAFRSPLRSETTTHRNPRALVEHCIDQLRAVASRAGTVGSGLDARCAIVVSANNVNLTASAFVTTPPAPQIGDPLHYDAFIQAICAAYSARF